MGAKISGKLVKPNPRGRTLNFFLVPEYWRFVDNVLPAFIDKDITIEIYERKTPTAKHGHHDNSSIVVEIGTRLQKRLAKVRTKNEDETKVRRRKRKTKTKVKTGARA